MDEDIVSVLKSPRSKIGEAHNLFAAIEGEDLCEFNIFMRSSPIARKSLDRILRADGNPFEINKLKLRDNYTNHNAVILQAYLKGIGLHLNFLTEDDIDTAPVDTISPRRVNGYTILCRGNEKLVYKKLLDLYQEYMETYTVITTVDDKTSKKEMAWDWVFDRDDVKSMDLLGITKEFMVEITMRGEDEPVEVLPETELDDEESGVSED